MPYIYHKKIGQGHPLVLIHGFCETHEIWEGITPVLSGHFQVFLPDLPGFGKSELPSEPFSIDNVATTMLEWLRENTNGPAVVVGHSLGGYVAMAMAVQRPTAISGLGLFHSTAGADSEEKKENRNKTAEFVRKNGVAPFIETFVPSLFYKKSNPWIPKVANIALGTAKDTVIAYTFAMRERPSREHWLQSFEGNLMIVAGEFDSILPADVLEKQAKLVTGADFKLMPNTGHMGMFENMDVAAAAIKQLAFKSFAHG